MKKKNLAIANTMAILEELDSSKYGHLLIRDALSIAERLLAGEDIFIYMRWRTWVPGENGEEDTYVEGWRAIDYGIGIFSHMVGCPEMEIEDTRKFTTMSSKRGEPKQNFTMPVRFWSSWFTFRQMFSMNNMYVDKGRVTITNRAEFTKEFQHWEDVISKSLGRPMEHALKAYSVKQMEELQSLTKTEIRQLVQETATGVANRQVVRNILTVNVGKTMTIAQAKLHSRMEFWIAVTDRDLEFLEYAKLYAPNTPEWEDVYSKFNPNKG